MCDICGGICGNHDFRCPNYSPTVHKHNCIFCNEPILDGEEYIENDRGEFRHYECFYGMRDLLEWLGYRIERMNEDEYNK